MYTTLDPSTVTPRHVTLQQRVAARIEKLRESMEKDCSDNKRSFLLRVPEDDFKRLINLLDYYCYLDEVSFVSQRSTKLEDPIFTIVRSQSYLHSEHDVLTRNLMFLPALSRIGVCNRNTGGWQTSLTSPPLTMILRSLSDLERKSLFEEMHPASRSTRTELSHEDKKWLHDNRQSIASYQKIISEFTREKTANFEKSSPIELLKLLYLMVSTNRSYVLSVKPLLKSLENKPHQPIFDNAYDIPYALTIAEGGERAINNRFLDTRDKNNPNLTKAVLNELLCYQLDACKLNKACLIRQLPIRIQEIKNELQALSDSGYSDKFVKKLATTKLEILFSHLPLFKLGEGLFEKMSLALIIKDTINQLISEKEVLCIASSSYSEYKPEFKDYQSQMRQNSLIKRIFKNNDDLQNHELAISRSQSSDSLSHRQILAVAGLHHYLKSAGVLSKDMDFDTKNIQVILLIVFDESIQKTKVTFTKNIPSSDNLGSGSTWNSLINYSKEVLFTSNTAPNAIASQCMPYMHQLFWKERYQQVFRLMNHLDTYERYISSKQTLLTFLIDWLDNEVLPLPPKRG